MKLEFVYMGDGRVMAADASKPEDDPAWIIGDATEAVNRLVERARKPLRILERTLNSVMGTIEDGGKEYMAAIGRTFSDQGE